MLSHARRRHARNSTFSVGCPGTGRNLRLRATAGKTKNISPEENFESSEAANKRPNAITLPRLGESHISARYHALRIQNRVNTTSVTTSGPKVRKAGMLMKALRQSNPPHLPPTFEP